MTSSGPIKLHKIIDRYWWYDVNTDYFVAHLHHKFRAVRQMVRYVSLTIHMKNRQQQQKLANLNNVFVAIFSVWHGNRPGYGCRFAKIFKLIFLFESLRSLIQIFTDIYFQESPMWIISLATNLLMLVAYLQYKPFLHSHILFMFFSASLACFMITDIGAHKFRLFAPFVMNIEIVLSSLDCTLCFCSSCHIMIKKMSVLFSFNQSRLYITCDMIYVIHGNRITFIVIVIVIVM